MPDIMHLVRFQSPAEKVFSALTSTDGIRRWWTPDAEIDNRVGGSGEFRFYGGGSVHRVNVLESAPRHALWEVVSSFRPEWKGTHLSFDVRDTDRGSELLFAHRGYPVADEAYAVCTTGWGIYFMQLQQYLETGAD